MKNDNKCFLSIFVYKTVLVVYVCNNNIIFNVIIAFFVVDGIIGCFQFC